MKIDLFYACFPSGKSIILNMMRLAFLLFFTVSFGFTPFNGLSQNAKINVKTDKTLTIDEIFDLIEKQTSYRFVYPSSFIKDLPKVEVREGRITVKDLLNDSFSDIPIDYEFRNKKNIVLTKVVKNTTDNNKEKQQQTITGTVTDEDGVPLPGVNITVEGTSRGTQTDFDGNYTIEAENRQVLKFSSIGFENKIVAVGSERVVNVRMMEVASTLDEIVIGYVQKKRGEVTGSVSKVEGDKLTQTPSQNVFRSLEGRTSGLIINDRGGVPGSAEMDIFIRGKQTLGDNNPLVIIDGIPSSTNDLGNLSARDVDNISVLKDASSAIYGSRASNGVIIVTTKRGREGKSQINIEADFGVSTFAITPKMMNSYQYANYLTEVQTRYNQSPTFSTEDIELFKNGTEPLTHPNTNWYDAVYKDFATQNNINLSATGGSEKISYFFSSDYTREEAMYKGGDKYNKRFQVRSNIDAQVTDNLHLGLNLYGSLRDHHDPAQSANTIMGMIQRSLPTDAAIYPNGLPAVAVAGMNPVITSRDEAGWSNRKDKVFKSNLNFDLDLDWITRGLNLRGIISFDYEVNNSSLFSNTWNEYSYNAERDEYDPSLGSNSETDKFSYLDVGNIVNKQQYYNFSINYSRIFNNHNLSGFLALETNQEDTNSLSGYRRDLLSGEKPFLWAGSSVDQKTTGNATNTGLFSYFGSLSYSYKKKYLLDFTLRRDGSSNFPKERRFGTFPSLSLGWVISNEPFMENDFFNQWLDNLKIRMSYGKMGNDRIPSFQYLTRFSVGEQEDNQYYVFGENPRHYSGIYESSIGNPFITWEESNAFNTGLDISSFNDRLEVAFDYFYNKRRNILITRNESIPDYTGLSLPQENLGKVDNFGFELSANYTERIKDWTFGIGGNFSYNRNKIVFMDEALDIPDYRRKEGHPMDSWLVYKTDGIFKDQDEIDRTEAKLSGTKPGDIKYIDINGDGRIDEDDKYRRYTSPTPRIQYGVTFNFAYKDFKLDIFFQGQAKAENYIAHEFGSFSNLPNYLYNKRWTKENKEAQYPRAYERDDYYNFAHMSDFWLYNAAFVRLKNVTLSYDIPTKIISKIGFKNLRIYLKGHNLWTWQAMRKRMGGSYYDPEMDMVDPGLYGAGATGAYYPQVTTVVGGLSVSL